MINLYISHCFSFSCPRFSTPLPPSPRYLNFIPQPLLPGENESKDHLISIIAPLPWERGWGEAEPAEPVEGLG